VSWQCSELNRRHQAASSPIFPARFLLRKKGRFFRFGEKMRGKMGAIVAMQQCRSGRELLRALRTQDPTRAAALLSFEF